MNKIIDIKTSWLSIVLLALSGCATLSDDLAMSAQNNQLRGNYDQAVSDLVRALKLDPEHEKSRAMMGDVFRQAVLTHEDEIRHLKSSRSPERWDEIVDEYEDLKDLKHEMRMLPALVQQAVAFELKDYSSELSEAKSNAAEFHYSRGRTFVSDRHRAAKEFRIADNYVRGYKDALELAAEGYYLEGLRLSKLQGIDRQKQAAKEFKQAQAYVAGYKDSDALYEKARLAAIKRVAIIPFEDRSGKRGRYGAVADEVVDGITSWVINDAGASEFMEIVSRDQLENVMTEIALSKTGLVDPRTAIKLGKMLGVHEIITGKITRITVTPERTISKRYTDKAQAIVGVKRYRDNDGKVREQDVWGDVSARVTHYTRTAGATISASYKIIDVKTARVKNSNSFEEKYEFNSEWATFSGDERALSSTSETLINSSEKRAPVGEEMVGFASKYLISSVARSLINYAK